MKSKAKRLDNGEWVEGYYLGGKYQQFILPTESSYFDEYVEIDPTTLCQQVRGTEFFEGDELVTALGKGYLTYDEKEAAWFVVDGLFNYRLSAFTDWETTGNNIHDKKVNNG